MFYILGKENCLFCHHAKELLRERNLPFQSFDANEHPLFLFILRKADIKTVPQIWYNDEHIGGYNDLQDYLN